MVYTKSVDSITFMFNLLYVLVKFVITHEKKPLVYDEPAVVSSIIGLHPLSLDSFLQVSPSSLSVSLTVISLTA